jgi:hypothetical protein
VYDISSTFTPGLWFYIKQGHHASKPSPAAAVDHAHGQSPLPPRPRGREGPERGTQQVGKGVVGKQGRLCASTCPAARVLLARGLLQPQDVATDTLPSKLCTQCGTALAVQPHAAYRAHAVHHVTVAGQPSSWQLAIYTRLGPAVACGTLAGVPRFFVSEQRGGDVPGGGGGAWVGGVGWKGQQQRGCKHTGCR